MIARLGATGAYSYSSPHTSQLGTICQKKNMQKIMHSPTDSRHDSRSSVYLVQILYLPTLPEIRSYWTQDISDDCRDRALSACVPMAREVDVRGDQHRGVLLLLQVSNPLSTRRNKARDTHRGW